jgi:cytochrome c oxidase subunit 2
VAASIATLWWVMLIGATAILVLVLVLLGLAFVRPGIGARIPAQRWLVGGGLVLPGLVLPPLLVYALVTGERILPHPDTDILRIEATAEQWQWRFAYPDAKGGTRHSVDVLHLPAERWVDLHITSVDVIHSFWVPRLAGKMDAIPGHTNVLRLSAAAPGTFHGRCAEFCGLGHTGMGVQVEVHAPGAYADMVARRTTQLPPMEDRP